MIEQIPRRRQYASLMTAGLSILALATPAVTQSSAQQTDATALVGRWSGNGAVRGRALDHQGRLTVEFAVCGANVCARFVQADSSCTDVLVTVLGRSEPRSSNEGAAFEAKLEVVERGPVTIAVVLRPASGNIAARLVLHDIDKSLLSRRLPDHVSASLERMGPPSCEPRRTS